MALPNPGGAAGTSGSAASSGFEYTRRRLAETVSSSSNDGTTGATADDHLTGPLPSSDALSLMAPKAGINTSSFRRAIERLPSGPPLIASLAASSAGVFGEAGDADSKEATVKAAVEATVEATVEAKVEAKVVAKVEAKVEGAADGAAAKGRRLQSGTSPYRPPAFSDGTFDDTWALFKSRSRCDYDAPRPYTDLYGSNIKSCAIQCFNLPNCYFFLVKRGAESFSDEFGCYMVDTRSCKSRKVDTSYTFDTYYWPPPAEYALVAKDSSCTYEAEGEYLESYNFARTDGYQACANKCRSTGGCTVFSMQNYKETYNDPELKDYDSRGCYWVKVSSAAECSSGRSASFKGRNVYTLAGADGPETESASTSAAVAAPPEPPAAVLQPVWTWTVGETYKNGCSLSSFNGLAREIIAELQSMGYPLDELAGPTVDLASLALGSDTAVRNFGKGNKCVKESCVPYVLEEAATALKGAPTSIPITYEDEKLSWNLPNNVWELTSAYRTPVQQHVLRKWKASNRCMIAHAAPPGSSQAERGLSINLKVCSYRYSMDRSGQAIKYEWTSPPDCRFAGEALQQKGYVYSGQNSLEIEMPSHFIYAPKATWKENIPFTDCGSNFEHFYLTDTDTVQECADACVQYGYGCTVFLWGTFGFGSRACEVVVKKATKSALFKPYECGISTIPSRFDSYQLTGASVPQREDLRTAGLKAFQRIWNRHNPDDTILEDGTYGPTTAAKMDASPANGFLSQPSSSRRKLSDTGYRLLKTHSKCQQWADSVPLPPVFVSVGPSGAAECAEGCRRQEGCAVFLLEGRATYDRPLKGVPDFDGKLGCMWVKGLYDFAEDTPNQAKVIRSGVDCPGEPPGALPPGTPQYIRDDWSAYDAYELTGPEYSLANAAGDWRRRSKGPSAWPDNADKPVALVHGVPSSAIGARNTGAGCDAVQLIVAFEGEPSSWESFRTVHERAVQTANDVMRMWGSDLGTLCCAVRNVVVDIAFQMGQRRLTAGNGIFRRVFDRILAGDWEGAAAAAAATSWFVDAGRRAQLHVATLQGGCADKASWTKPPTGAAAYKRLLAKRAELEGSSFQSLEPTNGAELKKTKPSTIRDTAVGGLEAYAKAIRRAMEMDGAEQSFAVRVTLPPSTTPGTQAYAAGYALVKRNSWCMYDAVIEYLGSFNQVDQGLQDGRSGLQMCANQCARTAGCVVFSWQNYKRQWNDPALADYDNRACYWIKVASASDCGSAHDDDTNALTGSPEQDVFKLTGVTGRRLATAEGGIEWSDATTAGGTSPAASRGFHLLTLPPFGAESGAEATAARRSLQSSSPPPSPTPYHLVHTDSFCKYGATTQYIGSYNEACTDDNRHCLLQDGVIGLQACANKCKSTPGCAVFAWPNKRVTYSDPSLANYDDRACTFIHVASEDECGLEPNDHRSWAEQDVYAITNAASQSSTGTTTGGYTGAAFECDARTLIQLNSAGSMPSDEAYDAALIGAHAALSQYGGQLSSLCCDVQNALIDFAFAAGFTTMQKFGNLLTAVALGDWENAAEQLSGGWCTRNAARCASHKSMLKEGCETAGYWALGRGFAQDLDVDHGVEQRWMPSRDVPGDPTFPMWSGPITMGFTPGRLITECLTPENLPPRGSGVRKWWTKPGEQPGTRVLGEFVTKHFGYLLARPYTSALSYNCRQNTARPGQYSVHSEGRAIDFPIRTWPCSDEVVSSKWYGHPTCSIAPGGRARNDLGDKIAMWFVENAANIGYALPS